MTTTPKLTRLSLRNAIESILETDARSATVYQHPFLRVTATRRRKPRSRDLIQEILLTIGRPNYAGRQFVKQCLKAGEPFPVKNVQLRFYPKK